MFNRPDNSFKVSLVISISIHGVLFLPFFNMRIYPKGLFTIQPKISYVEISSPSADFLKQQPIPKNETVLPKENKLSEQLVLPKQNPPPQEIQQKKDISSHKIIQIPKADNNYIKIQERIRKEDVPKKEETVKAEKETQDLKENQAYQNYYKLIRGLIKDSVRYPKQRIEGDIYVNFTLLRNGKLADISILDEESTDNPLLKRVVLEGINEASPFPSFPEGLNKETLNLSVIISFRMNE